MPLITPNLPTTQVLQPEQIECQICSRPLYWKGQGPPCSLIIPMALLSPSDTKAIVRLINAHNTAMWTKALLSTGPPTPYYTILVSGPSWSQSIPLCNDCWESSLLDLIGLVPEEHRAEITIVLSDHGKWGKDERERVKQDDAGRSGDGPGEQQDQ